MTEFIARVMQLKEDALANHFAVSQDTCCSAAEAEADARSYDAMSNLFDEILTRLAEYCAPSNELKSQVKKDRP